MDRITEMKIKKAYEDGVQAGIQQMTDHILHQYEIGKPAEIRGNLYWLKDARQNLIDIMNDIESAWNEENGVSKYIVPIKITYNNREAVREVIIETNNAKTAMNIAIGDFQHNGWIVDTDYQNYKQLE